MSTNPSFFHQTRRRAIRSIQVTNPAAGADWSITVPAGMTWKLIAIHALYTASANAGSREPRIIVTDESGNTLFVGAGASAFTANNIVHVNAFAATNQAQSAPANVWMIPLPPQFTVPQNYVISANTLNLTTGDQWSQINLLVEESSALS